MSFISPSVDELLAMAKAVGWQGQHHAHKAASLGDSEAKELITLLFSKMASVSDATVVLTRGSQGAMVARWDACRKAARFQLLASFPLTVPIKNTSGAGDSLVGASVHALLAAKGAGWSDEQVAGAVRVGMRAGVLALASASNVSEAIAQLRV